LFKSNSSLKGGKRGNMKTLVKMVGLFVVLLVVLTVSFLSSVVAVIPYGANYSNERTTTAPADDPQSHTALAGNVTYLDIYGYTTTQSWQGYYGNVSGTLQLADNNDKVLYNWSLLSPSGEVYATENGSGQVAWANIACFNLAGNHSALETWFNISTDDVDGINETFSDANSHDKFYTANTEFSAGECAAAYMYSEIGQGTTGIFEEVLLTDQSDDIQVIFTAILEELDEQGFDGEYYDFEMIVLENGHGTDTTARNYYFYVELE